jgi:hypothetical protein
VFDATAEQRESVAGQPEVGELVGPGRRRRITATLVLIFLGGDQLQPMCRRDICASGREWRETKQSCSLPPSTNGTVTPTARQMLLIASHRPPASFPQCAIAAENRSGRLYVPQPHLRRLDQTHPFHGSHAGSIIILLAEVVFPKRPQRDGSGETQRAGLPRGAEQCGWPVCCVGGLQRCYTDL